MSDVLTKPKISENDIDLIMNKILGSSVEQVKEAGSGKIKTVYFFRSNDKNYVIRFAENDVEFRLEMYLYNALKGEDFPLAELLFSGCYKDYCYAVSEKIEGVSIHKLSEKELSDALPSIMTALTKLHSIEVTTSTGYGWLDVNRNGSFNTFIEYLEVFFSNEIEGFWAGWHDLFKNSFLECEIFNELYKRMMELAPYCEGRRSITHTDFHFDNVIINNSKLEGIIDWGRASCLDFMFDVATLVLEFPDYNLLSKFQQFYLEKNIAVPNMNERFLCAALCNSLDGMRFWAKLGDQGSYQAILSNIIEILAQYGISIKHE